MVNSVPLWTVRAELPVPTVRPHDHHSDLDQALSARPEIVSAHTLILGAPHRHYLAATVVLAAADETAAKEVARRALQQACAVARLPTGPMRAVTAEPRAAGTAQL
jgi:hypothetical protein